MLKSIFLLFSASSSLIPAFACLHFWKRMDTPLKALGVFLLVGFLIDMKEHIPALDKFSNFIFILFIMIEVLFYVGFMYKLQNQFKYKSPYLAFSASIILLWLFLYRKVFTETASIEPIASFDVITSFSLAILAAYLLLQRTKNEENLTEQPSYFFLLGIFLYFLCSIFLFSFVDQAFRDKIWFIHSFFDLAKIALFTCGFSLANRMKKKQESKLGRYST